MSINQYKNIKPLIIGIGVAGKRHLETQLRLGFETGIYSINPKNTESFKNQKNIIVFDNIYEAINWSNLVHVCTPDDKHAEYVAKAIKAKKAVLCEKAFTTDLSDALYLQKLAHQNNVVVIVGQNYRLTPTFAETRKKVLEGYLGKISKIETTYFHDNADYKKRYSDKLFLYIGGSHAVDLSCWVASEPVESVSTVSTNLLNYDITIKFASGVVGHIKLDASSKRTTNGTDLIVYGEKGKLVSQNKANELLFYRENGDVQSINMPNITTYTIPLEVKIANDYLTGKVDSFWPLPEIDEVLNIIKVLDAIQRSASSNLKVFL